MLLVMFTPGDQPEIVPAMLAKMNGLAPVVAPCVTVKPVVLLNTMPVGPAGPAAPGGIATTSVCGTPLPSYRVEFDVPASATHTKPFGLNATPQPLTRCASTFEAL